LNKITDLKNASKEENIYFTRENLKEIFGMGKAKFAYFAGVKTYLPNK
jgi:hypothetical protein